MNGGTVMEHIGAIIGFGGMAMHHFKQLENYGRCRFKGVYDIDPKRRAAAEREGLKAYGSKEALLSDGDVEFVLIATTNEVHKELSVEALRAGKHVICEKPATISSAELEEITEVSKECGRLFTIDQNRRTNPDFLMMKRHVENGDIGSVYVIESRVEGSRGMPAGWRTIKALGGGMMLDWGVHLIDQLLYMVNGSVTSVYCRMFNIQYPEVDDNFRLTMLFDTGLTAHIEVSTNNYITHPRWYVLGSRGTMQIDDWDCNGKIVRSTEKEDVWEEEIVYTKAGPTKTMAPRSKNSTETIILSDESKEPYSDMVPVYDQFADAIEGIAPLKITAEQAMRVMKVMEAAFKSHETRTAVLCNI